MTRFEKLTKDLSALAEFLENMSALDPWQDASPWREDGYETCEEWLRAEEGEKGTYPWKNKEATPMSTYFDKVLMKLTNEHLFNTQILIPADKEIGFRDIRPLVVADNDHLVDVALYKLEKIKGEPK